MAGSVGAGYICSTGAVSLYSVSDSLSRSSGAVCERGSFRLGRGGGYSGVRDLLSPTDSQ